MRKINPIEQDVVGVSRNRRFPDRLTYALKCGHVFIVYIRTGRMPRRAARTLPCARCVGG